MLVEKSLKEALLDYAKGKEVSGNNADRKKCKTCMYRGKSTGCNYIEIVGHSRGCSVDECNVYVKGKRLDRKR